MLQAVVEQLVAAGADPAARTRHGLTPLLVAAAAGQTGSVRALLGHGAAVGETDPAGQATLALAAQAGSREVVQLLLDSGADLVLNFMTLNSLQFYFVTAGRAGQVRDVRPALCGSPGPHTHREAPSRTQGLPQPRGQASGRIAGTSADVNH